MNWTDLKSGRVELTGDLISNSLSGYRVSSYNWTKVWEEFPLSIISMYIENVAVNLN